MASIDNRIIVRISGAGSSVEDLDEALGSGVTWQKYVSPGVGEIKTTLKRLETRGLVEHADGLWTLSEDGAAHYRILEDRFDNSNGYGDYGF